MRIRATASIQKCGGCPTLDFEGRAFDFILFCGAFDSIRSYKVKLRNKVANEVAKFTGEHQAIIETACHLAKPAVH